jgi:hypothetical protein
MDGAAWASAGAKVKLPPKIAVSESNNAVNFMGILVVHYLFLPDGCN